MHSKKSAISLVGGLRFPTWARFQSLGSGTQSDPAISSITYRDHDYLFELPGLGSGMLNHYIGDYFPPSRFPGSPACEPNLCNWP